MASGGKGQSSTEIDNSSGATASDTKKPPPAREKLPENKKAFGKCKNVNIEEVQSEDRDKEELDEFEYDEDWEHEYEDVFHHELGDRPRQQFKWKPMRGGTRGRGYNNWVPRGYAARGRGRLISRRFIPNSAGSRNLSMNSDLHEEDLPSPKRLTNLQVKLQNGKRFAKPDGRPLVISDRQNFSSGDRDPEEVSPHGRFNKRMRLSDDGFANGRDDGDWHHDSSHGEDRRSRFDEDPDDRRLSRRLGFNRDDDSVDCRELLISKKLQRANVGEGDLREKIKRRGGSRDRPPIFEGASRRQSDREERNFRRDDETSRTFRRDDETSRTFRRDDETSRTFRRDDETSRTFRRDDETSRTFRRDEETSRTFRRDDETSRTFRRDDETSRTFRRDDETSRHFRKDGESSRNSEKWEEDPSNRRALYPPGKRENFSVPSRRSGPETERHSDWGQDTDRARERARDRAREREREREIEKEERQRKLERELERERELEKERERLEKERERLEREREQERQKRELERQREVERLREIERLELERQREIERQREAERQREIEKQRELERERELERQRGVERERELERQRGVERERELERQREVERKRERQREVERKPKIERERKMTKEREMERERDRERGRGRARDREWERDIERARGDEGRMREMEREKERVREKGRLMAEESGMFGEREWRDKRDMKSNLAAPAHPEPRDRSPRRSFSRGKPEEDWHRNCYNEPPREGHDRRRDFVGPPRSAAQLPHPWKNGGKPQQVKEWSTGSNAMDPRFHPAAMVAAAMVAAAGKGLPVNPLGALGGGELAGPSSLETGFWHRRSAVEHRDYKDRTSEPFGARDIPNQSNDEPNEVIFILGLAPDDTELEIRHDIRDCDLWPSDVRLIVDGAGKSQGIMVVTFNSKDEAYSWMSFRKGKLALRNGNFAPMIYKSASYDWMCVRCEVPNYKNNLTCCSCKRIREECLDGYEEASPFPTNTLLLRNVNPKTSQAAVINTLKCYMMNLRLERLQIGPRCLCFLELTSVVDALKLYTRLIGNVLMIDKRQVVVSYARLECLPQMTDLRSEPKPQTLTPAPFMNTYGNPIYAAPQRSVLPRGNPVNPLQGRPIIEHGPLLKRPQRFDLNTFDHTQNYRSAVVTKHNLQL